MRRPTVPDPPPALADLFAIATANGLDAVGACSAQVLTRARAELHRRRTAGLSDGMQFTYKNPDRSTDPFASVPDAATIVVGARRYSMAEPAAQTGAAAGRVARYAWVDHYAPLRRGLNEVKVRLKRSGFHAITFADDNSIVDREVASLAGLGWFGKNANLLLPKAGSWFVLGCVVTNAAFDDVRRSVPVADGCGACRRCIDGCPTDAIVAPGVVDARRCLAWLLQKPGSFPVEYRAALGDRIYGCDDCQEVCPPNIRHAIDTDRELQLPEAHVALVELLAAGDAEILARHGRWYIHDREPRWVRRNALIALGNVATADDRAAQATIDRYRAHPDPMLREHADWAAQQVATRRGRDDHTTPAR